MKTTIHRGKLCHVRYVNGRQRFRVVKDPNNIVGERIAWEAECLAGPKQRKPKTITLDEGIDLYGRELLAELGSQRIFYVGQVLYRLRKTLAAAGIKTWQQLGSAGAAGKIKVAVANMRKPNRKPLARQKPTDVQNLLSESSRNGFLQACKQFCRWATKTKRLDENSLVDLKRKKVRNRPHQRDRFQTDELVKVVATAASSTREIEGLDGPDRSLCYWLAATTGFRKSELGSLTPSSFALDGVVPRVSVASCYTKNGKAASQPLVASVLPALRSKLEGMAPGALLWPALAGKDMAHTIQKDMKAAGIPLRTERGIRAFHSLRNTYISMLFDHGTDAATAQRLARHGDVNLTLSYARPVDGAAEAAVARLVLPGLDAVHDAVQVPPSAPDCVSTR